MTTLKEMFDAADDEFLHFERIESPKHPRRDVCAFIMLHEMVPGDGALISASEHDEYFLDTDCDKLAKAATPELVRDLHRCGIRYNEDYNCLAVFS